MIENAWDRNRYIIKSGDLRVDSDVTFLSRGSDYSVACVRMMLVMNVTMAMATAVAVATNAFCSIILPFL